MASAALVVVTPQTVTAVIEQSERVIIGVPQSMLLASVVGALIGVLFFPEPAKPRPDHDPVYMFERLFKVVMFGAFVFGFAFMAGWSVYFAGRVAKADLATMVPAAGLLGVFIRPLLPKYLEGLEGVVSRLFGRFK